MFMKFGTQNKSNMLIINILIGNNDLDPKLQIYVFWSQNYAPIFIKLGVRANGACYDLDPKLKIRVNLVSKLKCANFFQ